MNVIGPIAIYAGGINDWVPGGNIGDKVKLLSDAAGIAAFFLSAGLLIFNIFYRHGARRPVTRGDLDDLGSTIAQMSVDKIVSELGERAAEAAYRRRGHRDARGADSQALLEADLREAIATVARDRSPAGMAALAALAEGNTAPAEAALNENAMMARAHNPAQAARTLHLKAGLQSTRDLDGALAACLSAVNIDPWDHLGWSRLGHLYLRMGMSEKAAAAFARALAVGQSGTDKPAHGALAA